MATKFYFAGKQRALPGVYSTIKSKVNNPTVVLDYGRLLIIDNGNVNATYGGGSGINGALASGADAIYRFSTISEFRNFVKGGYFWKLAEPLFFPDTGQQGISEIIFAKAATTAASIMPWSPVGAGSDGGTFDIYTKDEGLIGNGAVDGTDATVLAKGYAFRAITGRKDAAKWILQYYVGGFKGDADDGLPFDEVESPQSVATLIIESPEFNNIQTLLDWGDTDPGFATYFSVKTGTLSGTGAITAADISALSTWNLSANGTESYTTANLTTILNLITDLDVSFLLTDMYGSSDYNDAVNTQLQTFIETTAKFDEFLFVAGGDDSTEFIAADGSQDIAEYFDSDQVIVVHGGVKTASGLAPTGLRTWDALYHTCVQLGRLAGLEPQIPSTFKRLKIDGIVDSLDDNRQEIALDSGILTTIFDTDSLDFRVLQAINSLQNNSQLLNSDSSSFSIQLMRIIAQLNRELTVKAKLEILHNPQGVNIGTVSAEYLKNWTESYLETRVVTPTEDNLIISYQDVTATLIADAYEVTYSVVANTEVTKIFITGFLIN